MSESSTLTTITTMTLMCDELVTELQYTPVPYIALIGLNASSNAIHATVWNAFTVNRQSDRCPLYFKLIHDKYQFLACKQKKSSYEWHIPKGILKSAWLHKHLFEIPSVAVIFFDLDWDDTHWNDKRTECVARVEYLRRSLHQRNTRICLVLIQMNAQLPSDDSVVTDRAALLCNSCDLPPKSLFVLPISDIQQLMGYVLRMESALFEFAKMYYQHECKLVKAHRELLNKTTHQLLYVRHQFKIAFFSELRQDPSTAIKHYKQSYANLMEVRASITNLYEIKTVGGFVNYKICKLCFQLNSPLDAISQFRKHIDIFKNKSEPKELEFEHMAWLSKQFSLFGDLFDHAILALGLVPSQTQHPGYYYYEASVHALLRKKICGALCSVETNSTAQNLYNDILQISQPMEFFGQRPWRPGCQTLEPLDWDKEKIGIKALQFKEITTVNHSTFVINLLSSAINQFKKYKCPRMKRYLMVLVGEEYFHSKDYLNALTFLLNVLPQYRAERWHILIKQILTYALYSAYLSADFINFIKLGLEYIGSEFDGKLAIQTSIHNLIDGKPPLVLPIVNETDINVALNIWQNYLNSKPDLINFSVKMDSFMKFIECKPRFKSKEYYCYENMEIEIYFVLNSPKPIKFTKLNVIFSNHHYNQFCEIVCDSSLTLSTESDDTRLLFIPNKLQCFTFEIIPILQDIGRDITVIGINLTMGNKSINCVLQWSFKESTLFDSIAQLCIPCSNENKDIKQIFCLTRSLVMQPISKLLVNVENDCTAVLNEYFSVIFSIQNNESCDISNITVNMKITSSETEEDNSDNSEYTVYIDSKFSELTKPFKLDDINSGDELTKQIFIKMINIGVCFLTFTVKYDATYELGNDKKLITNSISKKFAVNVVIPFSIVCQISNLSLLSVSEIRVEEPFYITISTKLNNEIPIDITNTNIVLNDCVCLLTKQMIKSNENFDFIERFKICCYKEYKDGISLGTYSISWKRTDNALDNDLLHSETSMPLPLTSIVIAPLFVELKMPETCIARNPVLLKYYIYNRTDFDIPLELSMGTSDNFMYSGNKLVQVKLIARQFIEQNYIMYPLICGLINLPKFRIVIFPETSNAVAIDYIEQILPTNILVLPQNKVLLEV